MNNPRFPHHCTVTRTTDVRGGSSSGEVLYDGTCRSYGRLSTSTSGDVITSVRVIAIPVNRDGWTVTPDTGDTLEVTILDRKEYGTVVDSQPNNFGTDLIWEYVRN